jgi:4-hydroxybenzoate polyprenyltransferase
LILRELRPRQWTKNLVVLAAFVFALDDRNQAVPWAALFPILLAAGVFCVISSGVYVMNDLADLAADRAHPVKRLRPLASGALSLAAGRGLAAILLLAGAAGALALGRSFALVAAAYLALQALYTGGLKRVPLLDVFVISAGFVLRAVAGGVVIGVTVSPWLLICTFLMALFLALCKRRHEIRLDAAADGATRASLAGTSESLLNQLIAITAASVIIAYAAYTQWPDTVEKFGTHRLGLTLPFVVFGVFRYLDLVYRHAKGEQPEAILLTDGPLLADLALYGVSILLILSPLARPLTAWARHLGLP